MALLLFPVKEKFPELVLLDWDVNIFLLLLLLSLPLLFCGWFLLGPKILSLA